MPIRSIKNTRTLNLILIYILIAFLIKGLMDILFLDKAQFLTFYESLVPYQSAEYLATQAQKWRWLSYLFILVFLVLKVTLVSSLLWLGIFFKSMQVKFSDLVKVVLAAQFIFLLKPILLLFTAIFSKNFSIEMMNRFAPLSLASFYKEADLSAYLDFLLQSINIFEVGFWFLLGYVLKGLLKISYNNGLQVIVSAYLPAFALWLVAVTFFMVSNS